MSLKNFHLIFVFASLALSVFVGFWGVADFNRSSDREHLALGIGAFVVGAILLAYSGWFVRKSKRMNLS